MGDFSAQNKRFLALAEQFGFANENSTASQNEAEVIINTSKSSVGCDNDSENITESFNSIVIELLYLQEEIGRLKLKEEQHLLAEECNGLTNPNTLNWLFKDLTKFLEDINYMIDNSAKIQLKLANPSISNSLPIQSDIHEKMIKLSHILDDLQSSSEK